MSCEHSQTTAVLAAFGEAPDSFEDHLSGCAECRKVVAEHLQTISMIEPALVDKPAATHPKINPYALGFLLAAAVLLAIQFAPSADSSIQKPSFHTQTTPQFEAFPNEAIDDDLASLEMELALFTLEET
jgi:hypothetical protein